jgi:hypothetical protein
MALIVLTSLCNPIFFTKFVEKVAVIFTKTLCLRLFIERIVCFDFGLDFGFDFGWDFPPFAECYDKGDDDYADGDGDCLGVLVS